MKNKINVFKAILIGIDVFLLILYVFLKKEYLLYIAISIVGVLLILGIYQLVEQKKR